MYNPILYNINESRDEALHWLAKFTIPGAEFDSSLRVTPLECHPGTRFEILRDIRVWMEDTLRTQYLLWLKGSAGVGKSTIIQILCFPLFLSFQQACKFFTCLLHHRIPAHNQDPIL
ncbi:hypothetical protein AN958_02793 [Leucoagaricus sp. SymC.cos]|nr:hypothetical protein AN958_02793 [Leucoagaricus sp. SymC.cos]